MEPVRYYAVIQYRTQWNREEVYTLEEDVSEDVAEFRASEVEPVWDDFCRGRLECLAKRLPENAIILWSDIES